MIVNKLNLESWVYFNIIIIVAIYASINGSQLAKMKKKIPFMSLPFGL